MNATLATIDGHTAASLILSWIAQALLLGTALAGLTWLLTRLLRHRGRPAFEAALWLIVLIKFLVPTGPAWSLPLPGACVGLPASIGAWAVPSRTNNAIDSLPHSVSAAITPGQLEIAAKAPLRVRPWSTLAVAAYLVGATSLLLRRMCSYRRLSSRWRALPPADDLTRNLVVDVCRRLGVRRIPTIRISEESPAPFVMGFFRPLLVLSRRQLVRPDELETVVVHEVAHLRRGDVLVRYLQWIAGTLLFFWPIVAWVNRRIDVARECACDQWALRQGKLTVGEYARCLLSYMQAGRPRRLAYHPCTMATNLTAMERRIDMILESPDHPSKERTWGLLAVVFLAAWGGLTLTGSIGTVQAANAERTPWPATEEGVRAHAIQLYNLVAAREAADYDGNGGLSYLEKDTYLVALAMHACEAFMEEFPYADRNHSDRLDYLEAYGVIRGITMVAYLDRRIGVEIAAVPDPDSEQGRERIRQIHVQHDPESMRLLHESLDAQKWLLEHMTSDPSVRDLDNIWSVLKQTQGPPHTYSQRMLNHGGPAENERKTKGASGDFGRFKELEGNIASIEAKLAVEKDPDEVAKLQAMLDKLEAVLAKLQGS